MLKNVTLRLNAGLLKRCRYAALEEDKSLSQWVADLMTEAVRERDRFNEAKDRALQRLDEGFALGGQPLTREQMHER
jgi:hypothetical protein